MASIEPGSEPKANGEIQLGIDPDKHISWSIFYAAYLPVLGRHIFLVPVTLDANVADWLREDVTSLIQTMQICVIEPGRCPIWTDFSPDEEPERALWMAMIAVTEADRHDRLPAAIRALGQIQGLDRMIYIEMLSAHFEEEMLMDAVRRVPVVDEEFEQALARYQPTAREQASMMYTRATRWGHQQGLEAGRAEGLAAGRQEGREAGRQEGREAGRQEGLLATQARLLLTLLEQRGLEVPERVRARVLECSDSVQLDGWFLRAIHVDRADALFDE